MVTTPAGGNSVTVLSSKLARLIEVFVGRASLEKMGACEKALKSAWKETGPPARCGKSVGALMLISMAWTLVKVMTIWLNVPKSAGSSSVAS